MDIDAIAIRGLDRETVRRLSQRSDARGFLQLGIHAGLLFATGFLVWASRGHLWLAPAIVLHGLVLNFLFCALHESIHRTAFASRWANDLVASTTPREPAWGTRSLPLAVLYQRDDCRVDQHDKL